MRIRTRRYLVYRHWPWYTVHAGTGKRVLFKSLLRKRAMEVQAELETAFEDGKYTEYMNNRTPGEKACDDILAELGKRNVICTCQAPESGRDWAMSYAADPKCPTHGGVLRNTSDTAVEPQRGAI